MSLPIGGFMPIPLAIMIPFMATQSLVMGEAFGKGFQYGKRKISSMSNEEFNKLTPQDIMIEQTANIRVMVPELGKQMDVTAELQKEVIAQLLKIIPDAIKVLAGGIIDPIAGTNISGQQPTATPSPPPVPTTPNDPSQPPSFNNPPATNVPAPTGELTKITITLRNSASILNRVATSTEVLRDWRILITRDRKLAAAATKGSALQKFYVNRVFTISNTVHNKTQIWI